MQNISLRLSKLLRVYHKCYCARFGLNELIFFITYKCNFRCKTCFYANVMDNCHGNAAKELNIDEIGKIASSMGKFDKLLISGGEPFLRGDLSEICEIFYIQNKVNTIHLPTNGYDPKAACKYTHEILRKCPKTELIVSLPLDGMQETHDKIKGVEGSFKKVMETVKSLAALKKTSANLHIYIATVVNSTNINEIVSLSEFIKNNLPVDSHGLSPIRGAPYDETLSPPSYKEWEGLSKKLMKYHSYWNKKRAGSKLKAFLADNRAGYLHKLYVHVLKGKKLAFKCQAGKIIGVLEPNGDIKLCELTETIGNVRSANYDFRSIWFSGKANDMRKKIRDCTCTHACFLTPSIEMNPLSLINSHFLGRL